MRVSDLKPNRKNPRTISEKKLSMLGRSMKEFGDLSGIVFNKRTGNLVGGHMRLKHLRPEWEILKEDFRDDLGSVAQGFIKSPYGDWLYREVYWEPAKEKAAMVAANQHGGQFDDTALDEILSDLGDIDKELLGFSEDDLFQEPLEHEEIELRPYRQTHVLLSFAPEKLVEIQAYLEKIMEVEGVEIEQASN